MIIMQHFDTNICFNLSGSQNYLGSRSLFVSTWCFAVLHVSFPKRMELPWPCGPTTGDIVQVDQQGGVALIVALAQSTFEKKTATARRLQNAFHGWSTCHSEMYRPPQVEI